MVLNKNSLQMILNFFVKNGGKQFRKILQKFENCFGRTEMGDWGCGFFPEGYVGDFFWQGVGQPLLNLEKALAVGAFGNEEPGTSLEGAAAVGPESQDTHTESVPKARDANFGRSLSAKGKPRHASPSPRGERANHR